jgi:hypothetical protein
MSAFYVEFFKKSTNFRRKIKKIFNFSTLLPFFASGDASNLALPSILEYSILEGLSSLEKNFNSLNFSHRGHGEHREGGIN